MYRYQIDQWLLFFYFYCFVGWVWESAYVSAKKKRWVNRGFMQGPFLPIYGTGAVVILLATIPVKDRPWLVFLMGMAAATVLEYITGVCMEKLFHVRYWDYSRKPLNLNGHICLGASLGWGVFSVLLVEVIHVPVEQAIFLIPQMWSEILSLVLTVGVTADFTRSFSEAMDLKEALARLTSSNEQIRTLQKRLEVVSAFAGQSLEEYQELGLSKKRQFEAKLELWQERRRKQLAELWSKVNESIEKGKDKADELQDYKNQVELEMRNLEARTKKLYGHAARLLKRNPDSVSKRYGEALQQLKDLMKPKK